MKKQQVVAFAKALGLSGVDSKSRSGWVISKCPFARFTHEKGFDANPSFGLKVGKTFGTCFSCGWHGDPEDLLMQLAHRYKGNAAAAKSILAARAYLDTEGKEKLMIGKQAEEEDDDPDLIEEWPEWYIASYLPAHAHPYLQSRGVPYEVAKIMDFRLDAKRQRLGIPIRDFEGRLMGFHGRTLNGHPVPYLAYTYQDHWNRPLWFGEHWIDLSKPVLVVESVFDTARALQCYRNTISPLMASLPLSKMRRLGQALKIALMFDNDKAGKMAAAKLREALPDTQFRQIDVPDGFKDPGEMPVALMAERLKVHLDLDPILTA